MAMITICLPLDPPEDGKDRTLISEHTYQVKNRDGNQLGRLSVYKMEVLEKEGKTHSS